MRKNQVSKLFISFFLLFCFFVAAHYPELFLKGESKPEKDNQKVARLGEEKLSGYLRRLIENLNESSTIFVAANNSLGYLVTVDFSTDEVTRLSAF